MARTTVADVLVDGLARAGARRVFAGPGAPAALSAAARRRGLDVLESPEATAAGVLAAVSGEVGDGPGAVLAGLDDAPGLVRGLAHAQRDRSPVLALTAAGADTTLLSPVVKASLVVEPASAGHWIAHAANLALGDPRGPVHLAAVPSVLDASALPLAAACRPAPLPPAEPASLEALGDALAAADRPLVVTGLECGSDDVRWIRSFAEALPAPVLATLKGRGALADPHPLALGALAADHPALMRADLVLLLGVDAGELPPGVLPKSARVARIGRATWPDGGLVAEARGDLALVIEELAPRVRAKRAADWDVAEVDRIKRAVRQATTLTPAARLVALAREATPAGTLATGDVPALAAWQAVGPCETLAPLGLTPGYAVLAGVAAQLARPERRVVAFTSRRGLAAAEAWLAQTVARGLPIVVVTLDVLDDATAAGVERAGMRLFTSRDEPDFALAFSRAFVGGGAAVVAAPRDAARRGE
jgi:thiamine pyrophosphate-dependent acetolactate synthase large subunit-like protein